MKESRGQQWLWATLAAIVLLLPATARAQFTVGSGFDLFRTVSPGTHFNGEEFRGVSLGEFDFGGTAGTQATGGADTIVERIDPAVVTGNGQTATIDIELVALQLVSVNPFDWGAGYDHHYVTLQTVRTTAEESVHGTGQHSVGSMDITFDNPSGGTWGTSFFDVFFDIRIGGLDGQILLGDSIDMRATGNRWGRLAPSGATLIDGVNHHLNGSGIEDDFWSMGIVNHDGPHPVMPDVPEPGSFVVLGVGLVGLALSRRRK